MDPARNAPAMAPRGCDQHWLIIISAGRSGSTTILDMLNAVPFVSLSGELTISPEPSDPQGRDCSSRSVLGR